MPADRDLDKMKFRNRMLFDYYVDRMGSNKTPEIRKMWPFVLDTYMTCPCSSLSPCAHLSETFSCLCSNASSGNPNYFTNFFLNTYFFTLIIVQKNRPRKIP